jgi:hypothetical protein
LMQLIVAFDVAPCADRANSLREFASSCHWRELADTARDLIDSKCGGQTRPRQRRSSCKQPRPFSGRAER